MRPSPLLLVAAAVGLTACSPDAEPAAGGALGPAWRPEGPTRTVTLPDGSQIEAELRVSPAEVARGMMLRPALPPDKGMLFIFSEMDERPFWMYQTPNPLDIIWLDDSKRIVEIEFNAPPCPSADARDCPTFGGSAPSVYVLEIAAGQAAARGLKVGDSLDF